jgi:hypothetical protein
MTVRLSLGDKSKTGHKLGRRRFLGGVGAGGLATAAAVFGFAPDANALVAAGCCGLICSPSHTLAQCESGAHYVWECTESGGFLYCNCCEHGWPAHPPPCNGTYYSSYSCQYP